MGRDQQASSIGHALSVSGSKGRVALKTASDEVTVGTFLAIRTRTTTVVASVTHVSAQNLSGAGDYTFCIGDVDLLGQIAYPEGGARFTRGLTDYPRVGDPVVPLSHADLQIIFEHRGPNAAYIGSLQQDESVRATIKVDDVLSKHFAIFGTTGVGKSSGVALLLREITQVRPDLKLLLLDPHNEYGRCFGGRAEILRQDSLRLPFWLFNFEEILDVFFRGRPSIDEEKQILAELIPAAKNMFAASRTGFDRGLRKPDSVGGYSVDTPVPYRHADLVSLIEDRMGKLENRAMIADYSRLLGRIEAVRKDPRYGFMFEGANVGGDTMVEALGQLFRLTSEESPITVMQLAGFPAEVTDSVVSVLCRMAFDFGQWSDGATPLLVVCEEAHRYAPADRTLGFGPTRKALSRIAKEGRKYGVCLGVVTQRPGELDSTIISQCSTVFAMRMANDRDQAIIRAAVSDAAESLLAFVPTLGTREVFAFGEGVSLPTRLKFKELAAHLLPAGEAEGAARHRRNALNPTLIASVVERWRTSTMGARGRSDRDLALPAPASNAPLPQMPTIAPRMSDPAGRLASLGGVAPSGTSPGGRLPQRS